jgi:CheY-like chemotaxis protein
MSHQETDIRKSGTDEARQAIHDVAAIIISVRALAETLAEHVPTLVAVSRSRFAANETLIPPKTLDSLPSIPKEIIDLCTSAQRTLQTFGKKFGPPQHNDENPTHGSARAEGRESAAADDQVARPGAKILLVEDEETFRYTLSQRLLAQGCRVILSGNGEEALRLLDKEDFDLVLMDLRLAGMGGGKTTKRLREKEAAQNRHTRVVGITASPLLEDQILAKAAGMDEVLVKPIDEAAFRSLINLDK